MCGYSERAYYVRTLNVYMNIPQHHLNIGLCDLHILMNHTSTINIMNININVKSHGTSWNYLHFLPVGGAMPAMITRPRTLRRSMGGWIPGR